MPVEEENVINKEKIIRGDDNVSFVKLKSRQQLNIVREHLQNRRLLWFDHLKRMEWICCPSEDLIFQVNGNLARGRRDLEE